MYSALQQRIEGLRSKALTNPYTTNLIQRVESYTQRVSDFRAAAATTVEARRAAALSFVKEYQDLVRDIIGEKYTKATEKVDALKTKTTAFVSSEKQKREVLIKATKERVSRVRQSVTDRKNRLTSSAAAIAEKSVDRAARTTARASNVALRMGRVAREAAPPAAIQYLDKRADQLKPYATKALDRVQYADRRLGGYGAAFVSRVNNCQLSENAEPTAVPAEYAHGN